MLIGYAFKTTPHGTTLRCLTCSLNFSRSYVTSREEIDLDEPHPMACNGCARRLTLLAGLEEGPEDRDFSRFRPDSLREFDEPHVEKLEEMLVCARRIYGDDLDRFLFRPVDWFKTFLLGTGCDVTQAEWLAEKAAQAYLKSGYLRRR